jgi:hypothetical protein
MSGKNEKTPSLKLVLSPPGPGPPSSLKHRRSTLTNPEIELLKREREDLRRKHPQISESERLSEKIESLERQTRILLRHEHEEAKRLKDIKPVGGMKFISRPKIRAYFHGSELFRSCGDNEYAATTSISLFTDLLFVGVLAVTASVAVVSSEASNLLRFVVQFLPSWRIWCYIRDIVAMYEMNAASQRFLVLWVLCLLVGFTVKLFL